MAVHSSAELKASDLSQKPIPAWARWLMPSMADIVFLAIISFILLFQSSSFVNSDGDLARHLLLGRQILSDHNLPTSDVWSHTSAGAPFVPFEWLSELIFALIYQFQGLPGVIAFSAALVALPYLLITRWSIRDGADPAITFILVIAATMAASIHWLARPHLFSLLIALLWTRSLFHFRSTGQARYLLPLPPLMILWVNLHGGFLAGFVVLAVFLGAPLLARLWASRGDAPQEETWRHTIMLAGATAASTVAVGINPAGFALWPHMFGYFQLKFMLDNTAEHMSPNFHQLSPQIFIMLALLGLVAMAWRAREPDPVELGLVTVWAAFGTFSARHIPMFVVLCTPMLARVASDVVRELIPRGLLPSLGAMDRKLGSPLLPVVGAGAAFLLYTGTVGGYRPPTDFSTTSFPAEALAAADRMELHGNVFNHFPWGGYVLFKTYPRYPIFIDGETELYGDAVSRDYAAVARLEPNWEQVLDQYHIGWVLIPHRSPLSQVLERTQGWTQAYQDPTADIFVRSARAGALSSGREVEDGRR